MLVAMWVGEKSAMWQFLSTSVPFLITHHCPLLSSLSHSDTHARARTLTERRTHAHSSLVRPLLCIQMASERRFFWAKSPLPFLQQILTQTFTTQCQLSSRGANMNLQNRGGGQKKPTQARTRRARQRAPSVRAQRWAQKPNAARCNLTNTLN